jgi:uncharacterized membrane protein
LRLFGPVLYSIGFREDRNMAKRIATTFAVVSLALTAIASADVLLLDGIELDQSSRDQRPRAGMSMSGVEAAYGAPSQRHSAVGEPPITRWDYPGFSVYFEHDLVIHAVARHTD